MTYTNWGRTNGDFEPVNDDTMGCAKICHGPNCEPGWKSTSCDDPLPFICKYDCKLEALEMITSSAKLLFSQTNVLWVGTVLTTPAIGLKGHSLEKQTWSTH